MSKHLARSKSLGGLTDLMGLHSSRIGRVRGVISGSDPNVQKSMSINYQLITKNPPISRPNPHTLEDSIHQAFDYSYFCEESAYYLLDLKHSYVLTRNGWVLTRNRDFLLESVYKPEVVDLTGVKHIVLWPKVERVSGSLVLAYKDWSTYNYYHWLLEFLPKISALVDPPEASFLGSLGDSRILLPSNPKPWMIQSLQMLGLQDEQLFQTKSRQLQVDQLFFIPNCGKLYNLPLWAINWLRDHFLPFVDNSQVWSKRVYISRRKAPSRHVQNEAQVLHLLSNYGFQEITLEDLNLTDQISLFSQAEIIVGPHGGGFSNIVFSTNATLIDIFEPKHVNSCFYILCHDCGHDYWYLMAETVNGGNMRVDLSKLERTLEYALKQREKGSTEISDFTSRGTNE